jgi:hypothetical protein
MQLVAIVFIIPWKALYMFRVLFTPIIRSALKLYMQFLVKSRVGMVSDPVCYKMVRCRELYAEMHGQQNIKFCFSLYYSVHQAGASNFFSS